MLTANHNPKGIYENSMSNRIAFSIDLEPNKDGSFDGIAEAMNWFDGVVPRGTVYTTYRIASDRPAIVKQLARNHEIGVHVHAKEFGYEDDDLAALNRESQYELINKTRAAVAEAAGLSPAALTAFRAGRHKASLETLAVLADLDFELDASVNVRYREYMPATVTDRVIPFKHDSGLIEVPTTYGEPPLFSRVGFRAGINGNVTATAHELRTDRLVCSGLQAISWLFKTTDGIISMYMHPYDATSYHSELENCGPNFRHRLENIIRQAERRFITASELVNTSSIPRNNAGVGDDG